ncbi:YxeA family protein [Staphylococcus aureus]
MKRTLIIVTIVLLIIILSLLLVRNEHLYCFNRLLKKVSYAKVPKDTQDYRNITVHLRKMEKKKSYKLDFLGYDPTKEYVKENHKGKYVRSIEYITKDIPSFLNEVTDSDNLKMFL